MDLLTNQILALTQEPALLIRGERVVFANDSAIQLLGRDCQSKSVRALFGEDVAGAQAHDFLAQIPSAAGGFFLRATNTPDGRVIFVNPRRTRPDLLNEPFLYAMRASLTGINISLANLRTRFEERGDQESSADLCSITADYYRLLRIESNASLALADAQGSLPFSPAMTNLSFLCRSVMEAAAPFFPQVNFLAEAGEEIFAPADANLIRQLLLNLISNALHHGKCRTLRLRLSEGRRGPILSISDDGQGIASQELHQAFDRYRHSFPLQRMSGGPGLGLTVCQAIAAAHGGTVLLESRPEHGTEVRVSLSREAIKAQLHSLPGDPGISSQQLFTGLADCLPTEAFSPLYLD